MFNESGTNVFGIIMIHVFQLNLKIFDVLSLLTIFVIITVHALEDAILDLTCLSSLSWLHYVY